MESPEQTIRRLQKELKQKDTAISKREKTIGLLREQLLREDSLVERDRRCGPPRD